MKKLSAFSLKSNGFTLIELMVVLALISLMSVVAIASFVKFNQSQTFQAGVNDFITALNFARASAASQVKPKTSALNCKASSSLSYYKVTINTVSSYSVVAVCGDGNVTVSTYSFPQNVQFSGGDVAKNIVFSILTGGATGANQVTISGYSQTKIVNVDVIGKITTQ